jgi:hypothetical protein
VFSERARFPLDHAPDPDKSIVDVAASGPGTPSARSPGYSADLHVVDGDPLSDLDALRALSLVVA